MLDDDEGEGEDDDEADDEDGDEDEDEDGDEDEDDGDDEDDDVEDNEDDNEDDKEDEDLRMTIIDIQVQPIMMLPLHWCYNGVNERRSELKFHRNSE